MDKKMGYEGQEQENNTQRSKEAVLASVQMSWGHELQGRTGTTRESMHAVARSFRASYALDGGE